MKTTNYECSPTGRFTYRQLRDHINQFSEQQLDSDVTIEDGALNECWAGELRICGENHDSLEDFHPVIYFLF